MRSPVTGKALIFQLILFVCFSGIVHSADVTTHVLGAKDRTLDPSTGTVKAGYYAATKLSAVDPDLAPANISVETVVFGTTGTYVGYRLPDTGQVLCYNDAGDEITCPAHGAASEQDASYNPANSQPSYTDNLDYTITDNKTGLMWKKCALGQNNDSTCSGTAATYHWSAALSACTSLTFPSGGYDDWRLPNIIELMSISAYNYNDPAINSTYFPNTINDEYWSSTSYNFDKSRAYTFSGFINVYSNDKAASNYYVRCVRAGL